MRSGADSAFPPTLAAARSAKADGHSWWGCYVGGAGSYHIWNHDEVQRLQSAGLDALPIWVPNLQLIEDARAQARSAIMQSLAHGLFGVVCLDTEHNQITNPNLHAWVSDWVAEVLHNNWKPVIYAGAGFVPSNAFTWAPEWGTHQSPTPYKAIQLGPATRWGMSVDLNIAHEQFPFPTWGEPVGGFVQVSTRLNAPIISSTERPQGDGYWELAADGGVFPFGAAKQYPMNGKDGQPTTLVGQPIARPPIAITSTPSGNGYWITCSDGGKFCFGDAQFFGSVPGIGIGPADTRTITE